MRCADIIIDAIGLRWCLFVNKYRVIVREHFNAKICVFYPNFPHGTPFSKSCLAPGPPFFNLVTWSTWSTFQYSSVLPNLKLSHSSELLFQLFHILHMYVMNFSLVWMAFLHIRDEWMWICVNTGFQFSRQDPFLPNLLFHGPILWILNTNPWLILGLRPANERRRFKVTASLIGGAQT